MPKSQQVLITGTSSGIGYSQAQAFLEAGYPVIGVDREVASLDHANYSHIKGDLTQRDFLESLPKEVDILVNTAGILDAYAPLHETSEALFHQVLDTNFFASYYLCAHVLPYMRAHQSGIIINTASIAGLLAGGGGVAYTASKHALVGLTKQLAYDYAKEGIRVNALAPGAIKTAMTASDFEGDGALADWVKDQTPARRWGLPQDVAKATLFLASDQADFIHGQVLVLDGGWSIY